MRAFKCFASARRSLRGASGSDPGTPIHTGRSTAGYRFRLEDLNGKHGLNNRYSIIKTLTKLARPNQPHAAAITNVMYRDRKSKPSASINARKHRNVVSWPELFALHPGLARRAWNLAALYGYKYPDFDPSAPRKAAVPRC
jgi:hypothetical protein